MAIAYDAPSNTITVTGYTEMAPCTFLDVWNADQAGGPWGVVSKQGNAQFLFDAKLKIGNGAAETWFADVNKQVVFSDAVITAAWQFVIYITNNANFRLGVCTDAGEHITSDGCSIRDDEMVHHHAFIKTQGALAEFELYSSQFIALNIVCENVIWPTGGAPPVYNCELISMAFRGGDWDIYNVRVSQINRGLNRMTAGTFDKVTVEGCALGVFTQLGQLLTLRNSSIRTSTTANIEGWQINTDKNLIDCEMDVWSFNWVPPNTAIINRQYSFNLLVKDSDGVVLNAVTAILTDKDTNEVFNVQTGGDGKIAEQIVTRGYYDEAHGSVLQEYGPFILTLTKAGYKPLTIENIILGDPVDWTLELLKWDETLTLQQGSMLVTPRLGVRKVIG